MQIIKIISSKSRGRKRCAIIIIKIIMSTDNICTKTLFIMHCMKILDCTWFLYLSWFAKMKNANYFHDTQTWIIRYKTTPFVYLEAFLILDGL